MRLSTRDLFAILAFAAVISWCAAMVGFGNIDYWIATLISFGLMALFVRWSGHRDGRAAALLAAICVGGFCTLPFGSLAALYVAGLLILATLICAVIPIASSRARYGIAMTCIATAFILAFSLGNADVNRIIALRKQYPILSLENRLEYEVSRVSSDSPPALHPKVNARLAEDEQNANRPGWRQRNLRLIHDREYEQFVRTAGFGVIRMVRPHENMIEMPPLRDIAFGDTSQAAPDNQRMEWQGGQALAPASPVEATHDASRSDFLDQEGFGRILAPRTRISGFVEHAFHHHPLAQTEDQPKWTIDRVELVSLLKFDEPRVYVLDHLPRMDQLSSDMAPTRELNEFEASALAKLRSDEDLVVQSEGAEYQMLGSLRAAKQCLDCHNVQRGELLGAFSYQLMLTGNDGEFESELAAKDLEPEE